MLKVLDIFLELLCLKDDIQGELKEDKKPFHKFVVILLFVVLAIISIIFTLSIQY